MEPNRKHLASKSRSILLSFCLILIRATKLLSLSITLTPSEVDSSTESHQDDRAWGASPRVSFGSRFMETLHDLGANASASRWCSLEHLNLEGMTDIGPLLERCPNLNELRLNTWEGFAPPDWREFIEGFSHVLSLKRLAISPIMDDAVGFPPFEWNILDDLARSIPVLRSLDLRTRGYSHTRQRMAYRRIYDHQTPHDVCLFSTPGSN
jgi:hypothetical protein